MKARVRVLVVAEHNLFREGICALLKTCRDVEVINQATSGDEAIAMARRQKPDVIVADTAVRVNNGNDFILRVTGENPDSKVLLVGQQEDRKQILKGLKAGSKGYISKNATPSELVSAIKTLHEGNFFLHPSVATILADECLRIGHSTSTVSPGKLTEREQEVLRLLAEGFKHREIAVELHVAVGTIEQYSANIKRKLHIHNQVQLIRYALNTGLEDGAISGDEEIQGTIHTATTKSRKRIIV